MDPALFRFSFIKVNDMGGWYRKYTDFGVLESLELDKHPDISA